MWAIKVYQPASSTTKYSNEKNTKRAINGNQIIVYDNSNGNENYDDHKNDQDVVKKYGIK